MCLSLSICEMLITFWPHQQHNILWQFIRETGILSRHVFFNTFITIHSWNHRRWEMLAVQELGHNWEDQSCSLATDQSVIWDNGQKIFTYLHLQLWGNFTILSNLKTQTKPIWDNEGQAKCSVFILCLINILFLTRAL